MMKKLGLLAALAAGATLAIGAPASAEWKPDKPVRIIVPWGAGGSTDQAIRAIAGDLEAGLGQKVVIVNQPGGGGAIGTQTVLDAPKDGYTWGSGAIHDLASYPVRGTIDTRIKDWHIYLDSMNATVISVGPGSPIKDFGDFITWMKTKPNDLSVAIAGIPSAGHTTIEQIKAQVPGGNYKPVSYDGGNPAMISTVAGETQTTTQLMSEQIEMIRGKKLRPLALMATEAAEVEGAGKVDSVKKWLPKLDPTPYYFGIWAPKGVPADVVAKMNDVWEKNIKTSTALKQWAKDKGQVVFPYYGEDALKRVWPAIISAVWSLHSAGQAKVNPADLGYEKP